MKRNFVVDCRWVNLAFKKRAYLSSVHEEHFARYAVDGIVGGKYYAEASNTNIEKWFVVDLGRPHHVLNVRLHYKSECNNCSE